MENKEALTIIREYFPKDAIDISESLELLLETLDNTINSIKNKNENAFSNREFENINKFTELAKKINYFERNIEDIMNHLEIDSNEDNTNINEENLKIDYSKYTVETDVEHSLYEDFTHKRPFGFRINKNQIIEVNTWQEMLLKTCELLMAIDEEKFLGFEFDVSMNGKTRKYFSRNSDLIKFPKSVGGKIFVETNLNSNGVRNLIIKLLKKYEFKINEYKIYLRADYSELNK